MLQLTIHSLQTVTQNSQHHRRKCLHKYHTSNTPSVWIQYTVTRHIPQSINVTIKEKEWHRHTEHLTQIIHMCTHTEHLPNDSNHMHTVHLPYTQLYCIVRVSKGTYLCIYSHFLCWTVSVLEYLPYGEYISSTGLAVTRSHQATTCQLVIGQRLLNRCCC